MDDRVTVLETASADYASRIGSLETWKTETVDPALIEYDGRLDAIELVIATVSTANIDHLTERLDALEQKVETNSELIAHFNDDLDALSVRISTLETSDALQDSRITTLENKVASLESCCSEVNTHLGVIDGRLDADDVLLAGLRVDVDKNRHDIEKNAQDITIIATQEQINAENINKIFDDIPVDEIIALATLSNTTLSAKGLTFKFVKRAGWCRCNISGTTSEDIADDTEWMEEIPSGYFPAIEVYTSAVQPWDIDNNRFCIIMGDNGKINAVVNGSDIPSGTVVKAFVNYPIADEVQP